MQDTRRRPQRQVEWLLSHIYHHVLAQSPSPEAAKMAILTAHRDGKLPLWCDRLEYKSQPTIRLEYTSQPNFRLEPRKVAPQIKPEVVHDYPLPSSGLENCDWERSCATRRDQETKSLFEHQNIRGLQHHVLQLWPSRSNAAPRKATPLLEAIVRELDDLGSAADLKTRKELAELVGTRLGRNVSERYITEAQTLRRQRAAQNRAK
jgi:hypothetical protein